MNDIFSCLRRNAETLPHAPALLGPDRAPLTHADVFARAAEAGRMLNDAGIGRGLRVGLMCQPGRDMALAFLVVGAHAVAVPLAARAGGELEALCARLALSALVIDAGDVAAVSPLAIRLQVPLLVVTADRDGTPGGWLAPVRVEGLTRVRPRYRASIGPATPADDALILHTSGTTARPKLIPLTHTNVFANLPRSGEMMRLDPHDVCLCLAPTAHKLGLVTGLLLPLHAGGAIAHLPAFAPEAFFETMRQVRPSWLVASPATHRAILRAVEERPDAIASHRLRFIRSGGAALPAEIADEIERVFRVPMIEAYGTSEAGGSCNPLPPLPRKRLSGGLPVSDIAILDDNRAVLPRGAVGEIAVGGPSVARCYLGAPEETAHRFRDGWFLTGDFGRFDDDGYLEVLGRLDDLINRGGRKIAPEQVEIVLRKAPEVEDAAAFPVPHPTLGQDLAAAVCLKPGVTSPPKGLRPFAQRHLTAGKVPSRILVVDAIPRNAGGKLERRHLSTIFASALGPCGIPPETARQKAIADIFRSVLQGPPVGLHDSFFGLGGDSLQALDLFFRLEDLVACPLGQDILETELTPFRLAAALDELETTAQDLGVATLDDPEGATSSRTDFAAFPLLASADAPAPRATLFWCLQSKAEFEALAAALAPDVRLVGMRSGHPRTNAVWRHHLGAHYAREIGARCDGGRVILGGNCAGALVMWEVAQHMAAKGRAIDTLFVMEATILRPYPGHIVLLYGRDSRTHNPLLTSGDVAERWQRLYGRHEVCEIPGRHGHFFQPGHVEALADALRLRILQRGEGATPGARP